MWFTFSGLKEKLSVSSGTASRPENRKLFM